MSLEKFTIGFKWTIIILQIILVLVFQATLSFNIVSSYREKNQAYSKVLTNYTKLYGPEEGVVMFTLDTGTAATYFEKTDDGWVRKYTTLKNEDDEVVTGTLLDNDEVLKKLTDEKVSQLELTLFNKRYIASYRMLTNYNGDDYVLFTGTDMTEANDVIKRTFIELVISSFLIVSVVLIAFRIIIEHLTHKR